MMDVTGQRQALFICKLRWCQQGDAISDLKADFEAISRRIFVPRLFDDSVKVSASHIGKVSARFEHI